MMLRNAGAGGGSGRGSRKGRAAGQGRAAPIKADGSRGGKGSGSGKGRSTKGGGGSGGGKGGTPTRGGGSGSGKGGRSSGGAAGVVNDDNSMSPNTRAEMSPITRSRAAIAARSGGGTGGTPTRGGGSVDGISPNTRAAMLEMSPNTRSRAAIAARRTLSFATVSGSARKRSTADDPSSDDEESSDDQQRPPTRKKYRPAAEDSKSSDDSDDERKLPASKTARPTAAAGRPHLEGESPATTARRDKAWRATKKAFPKVFEIVVDDDDKDESIAHGTQVTKFGKEFAIDAVIKTKIFPMLKFAEFNHDLAFSNQPDSICRIVAAKLSIDEDEVEDWWDCQRRHVYKQLKSHRNNTIKGIKKLYQGKTSDMGE